MSQLLFKLSQVPTDEADDVRQVLNDAEIDFYETDSGRWGLGFAAIWLNDKDQLEHAKNLIQEYQMSRYQRVTEEHQAEIDSGEQVSRLQFFLRSPVKFSLLIIFASALAYVTVMPFFHS